MSCSVSIGGDCDGNSEFANAQICKARKQYKCYECHNVIAVGDQYRRDTGKYDGEFYSYTTCMGCADIRESFSPQGMVFGGVWKDMEYNWGSVTTACFDQLTTVEGKRKLREEWMKWKGLAA